MLTLAALPLFATAQVRSERLLEKGWRFTRQDDTSFVRCDYDDSKWQQVRVPHDWAIYGPFSADNDKQNTAIKQDGQTDPMEHAGRTGGLPFVGAGWYRLDFDTPENIGDKRCVLLFDGAMSHARVYVNGHEAGYQPNGYNAFEVDATPYLNASGSNTLAVRLENNVESSRWYPGAGLYRNVRMIVTGREYVPVWGTQMIVSHLERNFATLDLKTAFVTPKGDNLEGYMIKTEIKDPNGKTVATDIVSGSAYSRGVFEQRFVVDNPSVWSPDTPSLYRAESVISRDGETLDRYTTVFGIRTVKVVPNEGFFLNGEKIKFKGVCNHHDLGPLGAALNKSAIIYRVNMLKSMGCNAIRTSHNMPSTELVEVCDSLGMMVMAESFDEWKAAKVANGYHKYFDEWVEKDLTTLVRHFRNSPSVVMWCIGNEVPDQWNGDRGPKLTRRLQDICHREDPTRPVTNGMDAPDAVVNNNMAAVLDVPGFNYRPHKYEESYKKLPQQVILGSETASTLSSRGVYKFPVVRRSMHKYDDHQASSYDVEHCGWSNLPEDDFIRHDDLPYCMGEFVWTGFDYLGEPTPYYSDWPSHSSLFGIIDLAGIPKDRYYLYRSHWNDKEETLHILPHWTWPGREGEVTPVFVYTSYPEAELFINGKSMGRRAKDMSVTIDNSADSLSTAEFKRQSRYRLMWMDTRYEPGVVEVVAYDSDGNEAARKEVRTAGKPYAIELTADRDTIKADGRELCFVTVRVVDKDGNLCPAADNKISFKVRGEGVYRAGANGDPTSLELFHLPEMSVFGGMMTAIVQSTETAGDVTLEASSKGLAKGRITIKSVK